MQKCTFAVYQPNPAQVHVGINSAEFSTLLQRTRGNSKAFGGARGPGPGLPTQRSPQSNLFLPCHDPWRPCAALHIVYGDAVKILLSIYSLENRRHACTLHNTHSIVCSSELLDSAACAITVVHMSQKLAGALGLQLDPGTFRTYAAADPGIFATHCSRTLRRVFSVATSIVSL